MKLNYFFNTQKIQGLWSLFCQITTQHGFKRGRLLIACALLLSIICLAYKMRFGDNIHVVIPGQVIRSASLKPKQLLETIETYRIQSIIDLAPEADEYAKEVNVSRTMHVKHFNVPLRSHGLPPIDDLKRLTRFLLTAPRPLLVHCARGADRTGLAAAIALILMSDRSSSDIKHQCSIIYGVFAYDSVGYLVMKQYFSWLAAYRAQSSSQYFLHWLQQLKVNINYPYQLDEYHN